MYDASSYKSGELSCQLSQGVCKLEPILNNDDGDDDYDDGDDDAREDQDDDDGDDDDNEDDDDDDDDYHDDGDDAGFFNMQCKRSASIVLNMENKHS